MKTVIAAAIMAISTNVTVAAGVMDLANGLRNSTSYGQNRTTFTNQYGAPIGSATNYGNRTTYTNQYGAPIGSSTTYGNRTTYTNQYGAPIGSSTNR